MNTPGSPRPMCFRRSDVEHGDEQAAERERRDERPALSHEEQEDREVDRVHEQDREAQLALRHPAGQDRVRRVLGAHVVLGVDAALEVEVVVDHVVRRVGDDEAEHREDEQAVVDGKRAADRAATHLGEPLRADGEQAADEPGRHRHREDGGAGDDEPLADRVWRGRHPDWQVCRVVGGLPDAKSVGEHGRVPSGAGGSGPPKLARR
jgi:hypothetical protein